MVEATRKGLPLHIIQGFPDGYTTIVTGMGCAIGDLSDLTVSVRQDAIARTPPCLWERSVDSDPFAVFGDGSTPAGLCPNLGGQLVRGLQLAVDDVHGFRSRGQFL